MSESWFRSRGEEQYSVFLSTETPFDLVFYLLYQSWIISAFVFLCQVEHH